MYPSLLPIPARARSLFIGACATLLAASPLAAQTSYTVIELSTAAGPYGTAYAASGGQAAGATSTLPDSYAGFAAVPGLLSPHAALWTGDGLTDLHPAALLGGDPSNSFSTVAGFSGNAQVGWGRGPNTQGVNVALVWRDTAASVRALPLPANTNGSLATATDGAQIAGEGLVANRYHALLWNVAGGAAVDLGEGWAYGVARGQQVGYTSQSKGAVATLWKGTAKSAVVIHPKNMDTSTATATDGVHQVGYSSLTSKAPGEGGTKGGPTRTAFYAMVWSGTAASAQFLSTYPYQMGFATGVSGSKVVGYAYDGYGLGSASTYRALVWNLNTPSDPIDLNAFLPAGYVGSIANSVDAQGNVVGVMYSADGAPHAAVWMPNP